MVTYDLTQIPNDIKNAVTVNTGTFSLDVDMTRLDKSDIGTHTIELTATLEDEPSRMSDTISFELVIECEISDLTFNVKSNALTYTLGNRD